jgi:hypothetical protein
MCASAWPIALAVWKRRAGSLASAVSTTASSAGPTFRLRREGGSGGWVTCRAATATGLSATIGGAPVSSSYSTQPNPYTSERASTGPPWACSGDR